MKPHFSFLATLVLGSMCLGIPPAVAQDSLVLTLVRSASPNGSTLLTITGVGRPCSVTTDTNVAIASDVITITTTTLGGNVCFPEPPPSPPINITVDLGHLAPGHYFVTWLFPSPAQFPPTLIEFDATAGAAGSPIPALGPTALAFLLGLIGLFGMFSLRRHNAH